MFPGGNRRSILGVLEIDTSPLTAADRRVAQVAASISTNMSRVGQTADRMSQGLERGVNRWAEGIRQANRNLQDFNQSDLGVIRKNLRGVADEFRYISAAAGIAAGFGIKEANSLFKQNQLLKAFSNSQAQVVERQKQFRDLADQTHQSYLTILEAANILLPTMGKTNANLSQTLLLAQRLALMDPFQGMQGAATSIREALSGEARSLAFRFEIPRAEIRKAINAAAGDPQKLIDQLDKLIDRVGISKDAFTEMMASGVNAFTQLKDTFRNAMGEAFMPLLQKFLIPGAEAVSDLLQKFIDADNETLKWIVSGSILVTAVLSPMALILSKLISAWGMFGTQILTAGRNLGTFAKKYATSGLGAATIGVGLGLAGATVLANAGVQGGDLGRIREGESASSILIERFKQIIVIFTAALETAAHALGGIFQVIVGIFQNFGNTIHIAIKMLELGFGGLVLVMQQAIVSFADAFSAITGGSTEEQKQAVKDTTTSLKSLSDEIDRLKSGYVNTGGQLAAPVAGPQPGGATEAVTRTLFPELFGGQTEQKLEALVLSPFDKLMNFIEKNSETIADTWKQIKEINDDFEKQTQRITYQRQVQLLRSDQDQAISIIRENQDFWNQMSKDSDTFYRDQQQKAAENAKASQRQQDDDQLHRQDSLDKYLTDERRSYQNHQRRLMDIQEEAQTRIQEAAANLDAMAVYQAQVNAKKQTDQENQQYDLRKQRAKEDFDKEQELFNRNATIRLQQMQDDADARAKLDQEEFIRRQQEQQAEFDGRRTRELADRELERQRDIEDKAYEDKIRQEDRDDKINKLLAEFASEIGIYQAFKGIIESYTDAASNSYIAFLDAVVNGTNAMISKVNKAFGSQSPFNSQGSGITPYTGPAYSPGYYVPPTPKVGVFDQGGTPPTNRAFLAGVRGPELIQLSRPSYVVPPERTANMLRSGMGGSFSTSFGEIHIHGDWGTYTQDQAVEIVKSGLTGAMKEMMGNNPT